MVRIGGRSAALFSSATLAYICRPLRVEKALEAIDAEEVIAETNKDAGLKAGFNALNNLNYAMTRVKATEAG